MRIHKTEIRKKKKNLYNKTVEGREHLSMIMVFNEKACSVNSGTCSGVRS